MSAIPLPCAKRFDTGYLEVFVDVLHRELVLVQAKTGLRCEGDGGRLSNREELGEISAAPFVQGLRSVLR